MNQQDQEEYQERMGSPEMEYLQYQLENPEMYDKPYVTSEQEVERLTREYAGSNELDKKIFKLELERLVILAQKEQLAEYKS